MSAVEDEHNSGDYLVTTNIWVYYTVVRAETDV